MFSQILLGLGKGCQVTVTKVGSQFCWSAVSDIPSIPPPIDFQLDLHSSKNCLQGYFEVFNVIQLTSVHYVVAVVIKIKVRLWWMAWHYCYCFVRGVVVDTVVHVHFAF